MTRDITENVTISLCFKEERVFLSYSDFVYLYNFCAPDHTHTHTHTHARARARIGRIPLVEASARLRDYYLKKQTHTRKTLMPQQDSNQ
jgi:hypothetical protein